MRIAEIAVKNKRNGTNTASESWYPCMGNNPVNNVDLDGQLPGDIFKSANQAAHDFGKNYAQIGTVEIPQETRLKKEISAHN